MEFFALLSLGLLPGVFWLIFSLKQDAHPEPRPLIALVFSLGMLAAILSMIAEAQGFRITEMIGSASPSLFPLMFLAEVFLIVALTEELTKYLAVRVSVAKHKEFDEPVDAMIYMITAALGFATMENLIIFLGFMGTFPLPADLLLYASGRFLLATPLHVAASGFLGFFLALGILRKNVLFLPAGFVIATLLHGAYNFSILGSADENVLLFLVPFLIIAFFLLLMCLRYLKITKGSLHP